MIGVIPRVDRPVVAPSSRALRRKQEQAKARGERAQRRSRARIERALQQFSKE